jgi:hypothetical protein
MQCPVCLTEFKNYNSYKVHRWRFHNPNTKYGQTTPTISSRTVISSQNGGPDRSLALPVAAASVGIAAISRGDWKKWLLAILIVAGIALLVWYLVARASKEEDQVAG